MKLKYISWIPAVIIMVAIFWFSSKPADNSNESSLIITSQLINIYEDVANVQLQLDERSEIISTLNHIVRKSAHFCEYAILAFAFAFHLAVLKLVGKRLILIPVVLSSIYAMMDEFHQTFIPGRAGMLKDVLLDTAGAATGSLVFSLIILIVIIVKKHKKLTISHS